ncbi:DUF2158 domain-containing protein [Tellurirhabdus bombi]|uniref:DUF2158 domain-containing protein n=1 Tax=Tellurirhabdus bombi TaxID=2907205 RepID=UPI001F44495E|nr:DUF2158 domain-containing protein [Tellurirhabdus bombi]
MTKYPETAQRINQFIATTGKSQAEIARMAKLNAATISRISKGDQVLGKHVIAALSSAFPVNPAWLEEGEGNMLLPLPDKPKTVAKTAISVEENLQQGDIVQIRSGGPAMTVISLEVEGLKCIWFSTANELQTALFPEFVLMKVI